MTLPDGTDITEGMAFVSAVWAANPLLLVVFAIIAVFSLGPYVLRRLRRMIPR